MGRLGSQFVAMHSALFNISEGSVDDFLAAITCVIHVAEKI